MTILILTVLVLTVATVVVHGVGTTTWLRYLVWRHAGAEGQFRPKSGLWVLISTAIVLIGLHVVEIVLWAVTYRIVAPAQIETFEKAMYFSAVTFTTLGYGDITLSSEWRLLSGFEAIDGILLIGWTTAFLFSVLQRTWESLPEAQEK